MNQVVRIFPDTQDMLEETQDQARPLTPDQKKLVEFQKLSLDEKIAKQSVQVGKKFGTLITYVNKHQVSLHREDLIDIKKYLSFHLDAIALSDMEIKAKIEAQKYGFINGEERPSIDMLARSLAKKAEILMSMKLLGCPESTGELPFVPMSLEKCTKPPHLAKAGVVILPSHTWLEIHDLINYISLLIVKTEARAAEIIANTKRDTKEYIG